VDELYVIARRVLLDALEALGEHREATSLAGAVKAWGITTAVATCRDSSAAVESDRSALRRARR
jgi:hypothetical protein